MTAQKGRTYDRTAPSGETSEKALASGAVPHMTIRVLGAAFRTVPHQYIWGVVALLVLLAVWYLKPLLS